MPTPLTPEHALSLWHRAAAEELGLRIPVPEGESAQSAQNRLYEARAASPSAAIEGLALRVTEDAREIIIYKKAEAKLEL